MSQFTYYLPGFDGVRPSPEQLADRGLAYAFERPLAAGVTRGPSHDGEMPGPPGIVICEQRTDAGPPRYLADRQEWRELPGGEAWVGMDRDNPPGPQDLARRKQLSGHLVELGDGRTWHVPCARRWIDQGDTEDPLCVVQLPQGLDFSPAAGWTLDAIKPRYKPLWAMVERYCAAVREASERAAAEGDTHTEIRFEFPDIDKLAVGALQLNYRISDTELALLGAYDETSRRAIIDAVLDNPTFEALIKKKLCSTGPAAGNG